MKIGRLQLVHGSARCVHSNDFRFCLLWRSSLIRERRSNSGGQSLQDALDHRILLHLELIPIHITSRNPRYARCTRGSRTSVAIWDLHLLMISSSVKLCFVSVHKRNPSLRLPHWPPLLLPSPTLRRRQPVSVHSKCSMSSCFRFDRV